MIISKQGMSLVIPFCSCGVGLKELFQSHEIRNFLNGVQKKDSLVVHNPGLSKVGHIIIIIVIP